MKFLLTMNLPWLPAVGGANKCNRVLAQALAGQGHTVLAVVPALGVPSRLTLDEWREELAAQGFELRTADGVDVFQWEGVEVHAVADPARLRSVLMQRLRDFAPDWALVSSEDPSQNLLDAALKAQAAPVVYLAHTPAFLPFGPQSFYPSERRGRMLAQVHGIVTVSRYLAGYIRQYGGLEAHVYSFPVYGPGPFPDFGGAGDLVTLINPCAVKGISILLGLARAFPEVRFGAVPTWGTTPEDRAALAALPNVTLLEPQEDVGRIYARTRVLLMPSLWQEAFGVTAVEAMLRGLPVLASDVGGLPEAKLGTDFVLPVRPIERFLDRQDANEVTEAEVPEQDLGPWRDALASLLSDPDLYARESAAAREAAHRFVGGLGAAAFEAILERLPRQPPPPEPPAPPPSEGPPADGMSGLTPEQRALLMLRLRKKGGKREGGGLAAIPRAPRDRDLPLSFAQQRLWFLDRWDPGNPVYDIPAAVRLRGRLDIPAFARSFTEIVRRHEVLRTTFPDAGGRPRQVVGPPWEVPLPVVDLSALPSETLPEEARRLALADARHRFDLTRGPLFKAMLLRFVGEEHLALFNLHHIVADGWSIAVLVRELVPLYTAFHPSHRGRLPELPALGIQYADFAVWQRDRLQGEVLEAQLGWWRESLGHHPPVLDLPADRPRPAVQSFRGGRVPLRLPAALRGELEGLGRSQGGTLFMAALASFAALLHRLTGQTDVAIGTPIAGRNREETEGLIGFFVNTLVLRTDLSGDPTVAELLARVREVTLGAYAHQDVPFEEVVRAVDAERDLSRSPLFQVMLALQPLPGESPRMPGLELEPEETSNGATQLDLELRLDDDGELFFGTVDYSSELFDVPTIERLLAHWRSVMAAMIAGPARPLSELPLLSAGERQQLLYEWNDTGAPAALGEGECLHDVVAEQAERVPDAVAVSRREESLTYGELARRARRLAGTLARFGVAPEVRVGICLESSVERVVSVLAVLEAGGAYVPLDPAYPPERLGMLLRDTGMALVVTEERWTERLGERGVKRLLLDGPLPAAEGLFPLPRPSPESLAYVIYTSGSTGVPNGVMVRHGGAASFVRRGAALQRLGPGDRFSQLGSFGFDASVLETFLALGSGATLCLIPEEERAAPAALTARLAEQQVTAAWMPPILLAVLPEERLPALQALYIGGEACPAELPRRWAAGRRFLNCYGPTETTVFVLTELCDGDGTAPPPIGRPLGGVQAWVVDRALAPVPVLAVGELVVGGAGLARGYLGRPGKTAERFLPDPFRGDPVRGSVPPCSAPSCALPPSPAPLPPLPPRCQSPAPGGPSPSPDPGGRLYRTGDLVRRLPDGRIEFLGRIDDQVKVRGVRVELGEVEAALAAHPAVAAAAVISAGEGADRRLVAWVVPRPGEEVPADLRAFLRERLTEAMVPAAFHRCDRLPLTPHGKVDRRALAASMPEESEPRERAVPRTPAEELVAGVWAELLGLERVSAEDDFFELGGHSLLATQAISRLRDALGVALPLAALFRSPTVAGLAAEVERARDIRGAAARIPPLVPAPRGGDFPLSFAQERMWFLQRLSTARNYHMPISLRLTGNLDVPALERALAELARRHESLRTSFPEIDGLPVQRIAPPGPSSLPWVDLGGLPSVSREAELLRRATEASQTPFDLARGPLMRAALFRLHDGSETGEHLLLVVLHHIVADGWSMGVLLREIDALYGALAAGEDPALPPLPVQYADFAAWQRSWLEGETLAAELAHWQERLAGAPPLLDLPLDRPRPPEQSFRGDAFPATFPPGLLPAIRAVSRRYGVTVFMVLLAALDTLLARLSGQEDLVVGSPIANRNRVETEGVVGLFVNTLALRADLSGDPTFSGLLARTREVTLAAYEHQDTPFEKLVDELRVERSLAYSPVFQVMFALQHASTLLGRGRLRSFGVVEEAAARGEKAPALATETLELPMEAAKFPLGISLIEMDRDLVGFWEYGTDLFDGVTVARFGAQLSVLLESALRDPEARLSALSWLTEAERHQLLVDWNDTRRQAPLGACLHDLVRRTAEQVPDAVAVAADGGALSYAELLQRSRRLAEVLAGLGVGPDVRVGIWLESSFERVIAVLGVLAAGGAYVPLEPSYPEARLRRILEDSEAELLLTARDPRAKGRAKILPLDAPLPSIGAEPISPSPGNLAYVVYTSGSTGTPQGVMVPHRGAVSFVTQAAPLQEMGPGARMPLLASFGFDASMLETFLCLATGATLVVVPEAERTAPAALAERLIEQAATALSITPALLAMLPEERLRGTTALYVGADACPAELPAVWAPGRRFLNCYGPTETTAFALTETCQGEGAAPPPIGRPLGNVRAWVADRSLAPVPVGVAGEVVIGGPGLARGYLGLPDRTAERFVPDPYAESPGERLYRTGDLGRRLADGRFEFLGRSDHQVKIRGVRIELGEVEAALAGHPGILSAAALVTGEGATRRLAACYVPAVHAIAPDDLRAFLRRRLPEVMVPAAFAPVEALPRNANGKVDRNALAARVAVAVPETGYVAPRTPAEELITGIWSDLLGRERVGVHDNFFDLGGHSLTATQVVSRLRGPFGVELPVSALFAAPTIAGLAAAVARRDAVASQEIVRVPRQGDLPVSFAQERMWFLERMAPAAYHVSMAARLVGEIDPPALKAALERLVHRHEVLRTTFPEVNGRPVQRIDAAVPVPLPVIDLEALGRAELRRVTADHSRARFDLEQGPLLRCALLRVDGEGAVLLLAVHHIVADGWSMGVLIRELGDLYAALSQGREPEFPALPVQYADYAVWQRRRLSGAALEVELAHWRERLVSAPPLLELPADRPRPPVQSFRGGSLSAPLAPGLAETLAGADRRQGVTLFMLLLAAFQALLARLSGQDDLVVGTPVAGRDRMETEGLIGLFVNTLALRGDLSEDPTFAELLARTRDVTLAAYAHQELPFELLVDDLGVPRSLAHSPLFQVLFALQNAGSARLDGRSEAPEGTALEPLDVPVDVAKLDLALSISETVGGLTGTWEYARDLFDATTIQRFAACFERLLAGALASPDLSLSDLPLLSEAERHQLLIAWNDTRSDMPDLLLYEHVEAQARRTPDAVALASPEVSLSYLELLRRARRLAGILTGLGVGLESRVGICLESSPERVIAVLAVLASGGAWVPLEPGYPAERLSLQVRDSGMELVISERRFLERLDGALGLRGGWRRPDCGGDGEDGAGRTGASLPHDPGVGGGVETPQSAQHERTGFTDVGASPGFSTALPILFLDAPLPVSEGTLPLPRPHPESAAYLIYTSGSTGTPNGVVISHAAVASFVARAARVQPLAPGDRLPQLAAFGFDASIQETFFSLTSGATLCLVPEGERTRPDLLAERLVELQATAGLMTPSFLAALPADRLPGMRTLYIGGEASSPELIAAWAPGRRYLNCYGPTEATVFVLAEPCDGGRTEAPPIGRPIGHASAWVTDADLRPVPIGVAGELVIGGRGLARGYLDRPAKTAERFVPSPFGEASGERGGRLYRTGDRARRLPDGRIEFLGRLDRQVKIRGVRIELEEVEVVLVGHPAVAAAVVIVQGEGADRRLAAFVVPRAADFDARELRAFVRSRLPEAMVPATFTTLDALPLDPHRKVDRRVLARWPVEGREAGDLYVPPRTPTEELLAALWADLLGVERIGARDGFFELGGHSLLATQVASRVRDAFGVELPLQTLFEEPTLEGLAARIDEIARAAAPVRMAPPLRRAARTGPLPLSFSQQRLWFLDRLLPASAAYNIPAALRVSGALDVAAFAAALDEVQRRHEVLRTTFAEGTDGPVQVIATEPLGRLARIDLTALPPARREAEALRLIAADAGRPFDLGRGPLLRALLLELDAEERILSLTQHHIVSDGWSSGLLVNEVASLYRAFAAGLSSPLAELPVQYADFAVWQRDWLSGEVLAAESEHWRQRLAGAPAALELPTDRPRPAEWSARGAREPLLLPAALAAEVRAFSRHAAVTPFMLLLAAWHALLARHTGWEDGVLGTPIAGRNRLETEGLIGFFVNTLALRLDFTSSDGMPAGFGEALRRVRETMLDAYAHQDLPFEKLVEELRPERNLTHSPLFQVMFALQNAPAGEIQLPGLTFSPVTADSGAAKFDLSLSLVDFDGGLGGTLHYAADLYDATTMRRLLVGYETLLAGALAAPGLPLGDLDLLSTAERHQLVHEWNDTAAEPAKGGCLHHLFERQAEEAPDATALLFEDEHLTYGVLDRWADAIARRLRREGVTAGGLIALCAERSPERVAMVLGVSKSGAAWFALDPEHPLARLAQLLDDAGSRFVLCSAALRHLLPDSFRGRGSVSGALGLREGWRRPDDRGDGKNCAGRTGASLPQTHIQRRDHGVETPQSVQHERTGSTDVGASPGFSTAFPHTTQSDAGLDSGPAYAVYTSGSTGRPKGTVAHHRGAVAYLSWVVSHYGFTRDDVALQLAPLTFDAAVRDILAPLAAGARLVLVPRDTARDPEALLDRVEAQGVTLLPSAVPALLRRLTESAAARGRRASSVRLILAAGERLYDTDGAAVAAAFGPQARLFNQYGATECTMSSTFQRVEGNPESLVPHAAAVGRPIWSTRVYVVGRGFRLAPLGAPGEVAITGPGLSHGYLRQPERTAEAFVPDPFGPPGSRLYRTGDLGRLLPNGTLDYLGRIDYQVKVRGIRVEPGEVEAVLAGQPRVRSAAVVAQEEKGEEGGPTGWRLVAFVVPRDAGDALEGELRAALREILPSYLIPAAFEILDALPLTVHGKVDRQALARRVPEREVRETAPLTPAEELVAGVWCEVLDLPAVGAEESFFDVGGHSLLATRVASRLSSLFGIDLPVRTVFEAPTVAGLARIATAAQGAGRARPPVRRLAPESRQSGLPISFAQERLWFLDRLEPNSATYTIVLAFNLEGRLDAAALAIALEDLVARHESLRTRFGEQAGRPVQIVDPPALLAFPQVDLSSLPEERRRPAALALAREAARRPFDLTRGPLLRALLLRLDPDRHIAVLTMHHIVSDGWSTGVMLRDVAALYAARAEGWEPVLPPLPIQYADYAVWQRGWLSGEVLDGELAWWRERLAGALPVLELPADRPRPPVQSAAGATHFSGLPADLSRGLAALGRREGATPFMVLLAAFAALLSRVSGETDVVVGSPVANRHRLETEDLIGFFVNTLALRVGIRGTEGFVGLLCRVRESTLGAYAHQDLPFERLVEELQPVRSLAHSPVFQVMFVLQNTPFGRSFGGSAGLDLPELRLEPLEVDTGAAKFDLLLMMTERPEGFGAAWQYSRDLFDGTTIARLADQLATLVAGALDEPGRALADLPLLSPAERWQLVEWNDTGGGKTGLLHAPFQERAARMPDAVAVVWNEERLTYGELDRRSRGLAERLRDLGVGPEVRVGISLERTPRLIEAMLGVLVAGGAYVPLDPAYPAERLAFMVEDSGAEVVLREPDHETWVEGSQGEEAKRPPSPGNLAYVLYTSGSTGRPKAVAVEHRSAAALVEWAGTVFPPAELDGVLASTSISFDLSVFEIFVTLAHGGRVVLAPDALHLPSLPAAGEVTLVNTVPSAMAELLRMDGLPPSVEVVNLAGEPLPGPLVQAAYAVPSVGRVLNLYGPSEDTTYSTFTAVPRDDPRPPAIGRPVAGTRAWIVDPELRPVPVGVTGELCLTGAGLARGYLGRPELTAESFVPDPFGRAGERLYRTGDLARLRPDGEIELRGRRDHQVKVRGFRIEPGEIEAALADHPAVGDCAVVAHRDPGGMSRLTAYVVGRAGAPPIAAELRGHLRERLPDFMVPSAFVPLAALPLTPNGKLDRRALRAPGDRTDRTDPTDPTDPMTELVSGIWCEVLELPRVGLDESFFALGGHSLLATRVTSRLREVLGIELPVRALFEAPTVRELARLAEAARRQGLGLAVPPIQPTPRDRPLPLSFAQERLWFLDRLEPGSASYNMPAALRLTGDLDASGLAANLAALARRHEVLRTSFPDLDGQPVQVIAGEARVPLPVVDLGALPSEAKQAEAARLLAAEAARPFDLAAGPLLRVLLLRLEEREHALSTNLHHIVADGWSVGVFVRELSAIHAGEPLPPLPVQYADFAVWQREWLSGEALARLLDGWRARLSGAPAFLRLPTDRPRPPVQSFRGGRVDVRLGKGTVGALRALAIRRGATLFMALLAGFQTLLQRLSGQDQIVVGSPVAGRNRAELEGLIGLFLNTLPLRGDLTGDPSFAELLGRIREACLDAYALEDLPFERLVEDLVPVRDLSRPPLFQVMLVLQNAPSGTLELPGLELSPLPVESGAAKLDLLLSLGETADGGLAGFLEYDTALFEPATARRFLVWLESLLAVATANPETVLSYLPLPAATEIATMIADAIPPLLAPAQPSPPRARTETPAGDPIAELIAGVWCEVLDLDEVGEGEDFFELGGHSLLATRVVSRLQRLLGIDLPVRALFEAPTLAALTRRVEAERRRGGEAPPPILPVPRDRPLPLSFAQERLWFLDRMVTGGSMYNMPFALTARGDLDPAHLASVLSEVARRHEALRTTFAEDRNGPVQVIHPSTPVPLPLADLSALPAAAVRDEARRLASAEATRQFDLARGPLLRGALIRLAPRKHVLLLGMHHIVSDGWSLGVLVDEVSALYRGASLPPLDIQYADFAVWQRRWLGEEGMERQMEFWRDRLAGAPPALDLPADRPRPAVQSFRGAQLGFVIDPDLTRGLHRLGRRHGATLFMILLAGFSALLARLSGQEDLVVGTPIANRNHLAIERLIGFFVNTLALRHDLAGDPAAAALLAGARESALAAYAHQDLPFERLVEELRPERLMSHHPLFQVMLVVQNAPGGRVDLPGLVLEPFRFEVPTAKFDLVLTFTEIATPAGAALGATLGYATDLFDEVTVRRFSSHLEILLGGLMAAEKEPDRRLSSLPFLAEAERHQLMTEWNDTPPPSGPERATLHGLVEEQARRRPDAVALEGEGVAMTYGELMRRSGRLARQLIALGVGPEVRVGVCLESSCERIVALVAVLRAGGAFVPLDPDYPDERLGWLAADSGLRVLLTTRDLAVRIAGAGVAVLFLDDPGLHEPRAKGPFPLLGGGGLEQGEGQDGGCFREGFPTVLSDHPAYVIYTSGSTGLPKGVVVPHRAIADHARWFLDAFGLGPGDRVLQKAPHGFDVSLWEIFPALAAGAAVVVTAPGGNRDATYLAGAVARHEVTVLQLVASQLRLFLEAPASARLPSLRLLASGGEELSPALAGEALVRFDAEVVHAYGPTEASIEVTCWTCGRDGLPERLPIGRPRTDARVHVADRGLLLLSAGVPGELVIGGPALARGYLGRPDLTAAAFVPDPFGPPGARLYRTGDLVRRVADGRIEFLGRTDGQVKLRGVRIEPGEIEAALARHPEVAAAAVAVRDGAGGKRLVAWVVPRERASGDAAVRPEETAEHVESWRSLYQETYEHGTGTGDAGSEFVGWNSSFTGLPISDEEMRDWADRTVERILALRPRRILEVGCGNGILLRRLAPHVERYHGTDFSRSALQRLRREIGSLPHVTIEERTADDWQGIEPGDFDVVILNSVSQYFPGIDYLLRVMDGAARTVTPGGAVFVGDVRSLPLLEAFAASVELFGATPALPIAELRQRIRRRVTDEEELVVDPAFFFALAHRHSEIGRVEVLPKRGRSAHEMARFRYDVVLRTTKAPGEPDLPWTDWREHDLSLPALERWLMDERPEALALASIPDARLAAETAALALLAGRFAGEEEGSATVQELQRVVAGRVVWDTQRGAGPVEPEDLCELAERHGYSAELTWSDPREWGGGRFSAVLRRPPACGRRPPAPEVPDLPWSACANDPLRNKLARRLVPKLRRWLRDRLPEFMVPASFVVLEDLPVTPHGKVDRAALPSPDPGRPEGSGAYRAPRDPYESDLAGIWCDLLGAERVGIFDNFFELGGHSLLATQVVARVRDRFGVELPVRALFEEPTIAALAARIRSLSETLTALPGPLVSVAAKADSFEPVPALVSQQLPRVPGRDP